MSPDLDFKQYPAALAAGMGSVATRPIGILAGAFVRILNQPARLPRHQARVITAQTHQLPMLAVLHDFSMPQHFLMPDRATFLRSLLLLKGSPQIVIILTPWFVQ